MVEFVIAEAYEIDIVGQTNNELVSRWYWRYFHQWNAGLHNPVAKHRYMDFQGRYPRIPLRLSRCKQESHFLEQIKADTYYPHAVRSLVYGHCATASAQPKQDRTL